MSLLGKNKQLQHRFIPMNERPIGIHCFIELTRYGSEPCDAMVGSHVGDLVTCISMETQKDFDLCCMLQRHRHFVRHVRNSIVSHVRYAIK